MSDQGSLRADPDPLRYTINQPISALDAGSPAYNCWDCGAIVFDPMRHDRFHDALDARTRADRPA